MTATIYRLVQPLISGSAYIFPAFVGSQSDTDIFQTNVTLAAGDVQLSKDGAAFANLGSLPVETGTSGLLLVTLSTSETSGIARFACVKFHDQADDEWQDAVYIIPVLEEVSVSDYDPVVDVLEGSLNYDDALRLILAALAGKSDGGGTTTIHFRDQADSKNRITATVTTDGNRTAVTVDGS